MINTIGYNLRIIRLERNLSQHQVAKDTGISVNSISRYENNRRFPKKVIIHKLADYYGVKIQDILVGY